MRKEIQAFCKDPKGEAPVVWKRSAAHKKLLAKHKAEDAFDVLEAIDALVPQGSPSNRGICAGAGSELVSRQACSTRRASFHDDAHVPRDKH